jgi:outer membrane immunogenic protein
MLRKFLTARGLAPNEEIRPRGLSKPLMVFSILALAGALGAVSAQAADLFGPRDGVADTFDEPLVFNWTGLYFGGHVGFGSGDVDLTVNESPFLPFGPLASPPFPSALTECDVDNTRCRASPDLEGVIAGTHLGFNQQVGRFVFGFEGSLSGADLDGSSTHSQQTMIGGLTVREDVSLETQVDWLALATLRLGFAFDRWLLYLKGGYATGDVQLRGLEEVTRVTPAPPVERFTGHFDSSELHHGWHIGVGIERALPSLFGGCCNTIIGLEYNFIDLGSEQHITKSNIFCGDDPGLICPGAGRQPGELFAVKRADFDVDPDGIHTIKARLSFKFGCCEAVAAIPPLK